MIEKNKRVVVDRWPSFNDIAGGARFINGVSEPIAPHEALRIASALSGRVVDADEYSPDAWEGIAPASEDEAIATREDPAPNAPGSSGTDPERGNAGNDTSGMSQAPARANETHTGRRRARGASHERR